MAELGWKLFAHSQAIERLHDGGAQYGMRAKLHAVGESALTPETFLKSETKCQTDS